MHNKKLGQLGEDKAVTFLKKKGYKILIKNYKNNHGEIDIIAKDKEYTVFIEVKTRTNINYGVPSQAVDNKKQVTIGKVASIYLIDNKLYDENLRFDIIEVLYNNSSYNINHILDAFQPKII